MHIRSGMENRKQVQLEFEKQAATFEGPGGNVSSPEVMRWIVSSLQLRSEDFVLDVAAGTALLSRAVAPHVRSVVALDLTAAMLAKARSSSGHLENIQFIQSDAEHLPFPAQLFGLTMTRLSFHHMSSPESALAEMVRVTVPGGRIAVVDLVAPNAVAEHATYDHIERLRDPSHTRTFTQREFEGMLAEAGLAVQSCELRDLEVDLDDWLAKAQTPPDPAAAVCSSLEAELQGGPHSGMRPFRRDGRIGLHQVWGIFVARRR